MLFLLPKTRNIMWLETLFHLIKTLWGKKKQNTATLGGNPTYMLLSVIFFYYPRQLWWKRIVEVAFEFCMALLTGNAGSSVARLLPSSPVGFNDLIQFDGLIGGRVVRGAVLLWQSLCRAAALWTVIGGSSTSGLETCSLAMKDGWFFLLVSVLVSLAKLSSSSSVPSSSSSGSLAAAKIGIKLTYTLFILFEVSHVRVFLLGVVILVHSVFIIFILGIDFSWPTIIRGAFLSYVSTFIFLVFSSSHILIVLSDLAATLNFYMHPYQFWLLNYYSLALKLKNKLLSVAGLPLVVMVTCTQTFNDWIILHHKRLFAFQKHWKHRMN